MNITNKKFNNHFIYTSKRGKVYIANIVRETDCFYIVDIINPKGDIIRREQCRKMITRIDDKIDKNIFTGEEVMLQKIVPDPKHIICNIQENINKNPIDVLFER